MNCDDAKQLIMAYLDGELPSEEVSRLKEHLAACTACGRELAEQQRLIGAIKALPRAPAPESLARNISAAIVARPSGTARGFAWLKRYGALAASLAIAMVAAVLIAKSHKGADATRQTKDAPENVIARKEEQADLAMTFEEAEEKLAEAKAADEAETRAAAGEDITKKKLASRALEADAIAQAPARPVFDLVIEADSPSKCLDDLAEFLRGRGVNIVGKISSRRSVLFADLSRPSVGTEYETERFAADRRTDIIDQIVQSGKFRLAKPHKRGRPGEAASRAQLEQGDALPALEAAQEATRRSTLAILVVNRPAAEPPVAAEADAPAAEAADRGIPEPTQPDTQ